MINIADHPAVQAQLERDAAAVGQEAPMTSAVSDIKPAALAPFVVADLPAVKAQLDRDIATQNEPASPVVEYTRAPAGPTTAVYAGRPRAIQGGTR